jgi:uncharacterized protein (TIGR04255 family)
VTDREVYPNAPLVLVAAEVRHPPATDPLTRAQLTALKRALSAHLPLSRPAVRTNVTAVAGAQTQVTHSTAPRFTSRDRTTSVTYLPEAIVVETTNYKQFERLLELITLTVDARLDAGPLDGLERVGLRYIDEIRVPELTDESSAWAQWVHASLLGPTSVSTKLGLQAAHWQGLTVFTGDQGAVDGTLAMPGAGDGDTLVLRYGPGDGYALDPGGELKRRSVPPPGPFFLLDIDSFWTPAGEVPPADRDEILAHSTRLHAPVRTLFESLITGRLRKEVLRHAS